MNCQDIGRILNDDDIAALSPAVTRSAREHLATCDECARDWKVHERMLAMPMPLPSPGLIGWQPVGRARNPTASAKRPLGGSMIVGALLAVGAAAAMVISVARWQDDQSSESAAMQPASSDTPLRNEPISESADLAPAPPDGPDAPVAGARESVYAYAFTAVLAPPVYDRKDELTARAVENIQAALRARLQSLPHLRLIEPESFDAYLASNGFPRMPLPGGVHFLVQLQRPAFLAEMENATGTWNIDVDVLSAARDGRGSTTGRATMMSSSRESADAARIAADSLMEIAMSRAFPPSDLSQLTEIRNQALDPMRSQQDRLAALDELGRFNRRFSVFDESVQRQVTRSIALTATDIVRNSSDPGVRLRLWEVVSGLADPYLVAPLADSLQRDSDDGVRLLAVQLLAQDFTSDPVARAALDSVSLNDSNRMIRNYARWAITDEAGRRALLTETLSDPAVPRDQRYSVLGADVGGRYGPYITRESAELLLGIAAATSQNLYWSDIISDLGNAPPLEVVPLLLERLSADPDAAVRRVAAGALLAYQEEPGVVDALRYARDNDPSPEVRLAAFTVR